VPDGNKERTKLEINPQESSVVINIFEDIMRGKGLTEIVKELNKRGVVGPKGKGWGKTGLYTILTNEIYTGVFIWGKNSKRGNEPVRVENVCPAIVDKLIFVKVQTLMKERMPKRIHPKRAASPFLFSGIARCGYCGKFIIGRYAKNSQFPYYVCGTLDKKGSKSCPAKYLNADKFEAQVITKVKENILTHDNLISLVRMVNEGMDSLTRRFDSEIETIDTATADVNSRLDKLYDAIETGKLQLDDLAIRIQELRKHQELLQSRRIEIESQISDRKVELADLKNVSLYVSDLRDLLNRGSVAERRSFIKSFVKQIDVVGNEATLHYSIPIAPEKLELDRKGVLPIVRYSGR
jgi:hypothetical protein